MGAFPPPFGAGIAYGATVPSGGGAGLGLNGINENLPKAPNLVDGDATYSPAVAVTVGGGGMWISGTGWAVLNSARLAVNNGGTIRLDGSGSDIDLTVASNVPRINVGSTGIIALAGSLTASGTATITLGSGTTLALSGGAAMTVNSFGSVDFSGAPITGGAYTYPVALQSAQTATRVFSVAWTYDPAEFTEDADDAYIQTINNTGEAARAAVPIPHRGVLDSVSVTIRGATFFSALPASMPTVTVYKVTHSTGATTVLGTQTDTSATFGDYHTVHQITVSGIGADVNRAVESVFVKVATESGANSSQPSRLYRTIATSVAITSVYGH